MASTLNRTGDSAPQVDKGHGTRALGPSDSSDSGSDIVGGAGLMPDQPLPLDTGTNDDAEYGAGAGRDIGDTELDSDSDAAGTGERMSAGRDAAEPDRDRLPDRVEGEPSLDVGSVADLAEDADPTDADFIDDESIDTGSAGDEPPRLP